MSQELEGGHSQQFSMEEENKEQEMAEQGNRNLIVPEAPAAAEGVDIEDQGQEIMEAEKEVQVMEGEEEPSDEEDLEEEKQDQEEEEVSQLDNASHEEGEERSEQHQEGEERHNSNQEGEKRHNSNEQGGQISVNEIQVKLQNEGAEQPEIEPLKEPEGVPEKEPQEEPNRYRQAEQRIEVKEPLPDSPLKHEEQPEAPKLEVVEVRVVAEAEPLSQQQHQEELQAQAENAREIQLEHRLQPVQPQPQQPSHQIEPQPQRIVEEEPHIEPGPHIQPETAQLSQRHMIELQKIQQYVHKLQRQLQASHNEVSHLQKELIYIRSSNSSLRKELESSRQSSLELRQKKLKGDLQRTVLMKQSEKLKRQTEMQKKKLQEVEAMGDVFVLKATLQNLKLLSQTQKREIEQLKAVNEEDKNTSQIQENINVFKRYQEEQLLLTQKLQHSQRENQKMAQELSELRTTLPQLRLSLESSLSQAAALKAQQLQLKQTISNWQQRWLEFQSQRQSNRKAVQLQQSIINYESQKNIMNQQQLMHLNILTDKQQKNILLREYLILQSKNKELMFDLQEVTVKARKLERQQHRIQAHYIKKKQYLDLSAKYNKAKKCLEGTFEQLRLYKRTELKGQTIQEEVIELLEGVEARQCQNFIKNTNNLVSNLHDQVDLLEQKSTANDLKLQLAHSLNTIAILKKEQSSNDKLLHLMNDDISLKNRLLLQKNQLIASLRKRKDEGQSSKFGQKCMKMQNQIKSLKQTISIYETQNILLVNEISAINGQLNHWKLLYNQIKENLSEKIALSFQDPSERHRNDERMEEQSSNVVCKECQLHKLSLLNERELQEQECQTENLYEYYYKEIKQLLNFLKKASKQYDHIPNTTKEMVAVVNSIKERFVAEFKQRYEKVQNTYKSKLDEVKKEKSQNQSWRNKTRDEIREEFQDVRELIINNRLINALRQAKNLIDYLENEVQKNEEDNNQEEVEEEGQVVQEDKKNQ